MNSANTLPPDTIEALQKLLAEAYNSLTESALKISELECRNHFLSEQWRLAQHQRFAKSSEKSPDQGELFNEVEVLLDTEEPPAPEENIAPTSVKKVPRRQPLAPELPRKTVTIDIPEAAKACQCCGHALHKMGEEVSEKLLLIPARIEVIRTVRPKYSCRACEKTATATPVVITPVPAAIIPKSFATPSLLAFIIAYKYQFALPLYRLEALFDPMGIELSRQTMSRWMLICADVLTPLYRRMQEYLCQEAAIHADETPLTVLKEDREQCRMWVYCSGGDSPDAGHAQHNIVLYDYNASRAASVPRQFLQGFHGFLHCDGYAAYDTLPVTTVGCWAHARRKFKDAEKTLPKGTHSPKIRWALNSIQKLYAVEKLAQGKSPAEIFALRQSKSLPLLLEFKAWLDKSAAQSVQSPVLQKAIGYCLNQWPKLLRYCDDGQLAIDNNRAERAIKPFVIGRKNWLFSNTPSGATASAVLYSMVESAKANGLDSRAYLEKCFEALPLLPNAESLDQLLPWNIILAENEV